MKIALFLCSASVLFSLPQGIEVQHGAVEINTLDQAMSIALAQSKTIVNWDSFSIGAAEKVHIQMPGTDSSMLNRVVGGNLSEIYGTLSSNGQVWLINPAGILIGRNAIIETGAFLASTFDVMNRDFLDGLMKFSGEAGKIQHLGTIRAPYGKVHILAKEIEIEGQIEAQTIETAYFFAKGESLIAFDPDRKADHPYAHAINVTGTLEAKEIHLFADEIDVEAKMRAAGGEILIGGDYQGKNISVPNATRTIVRAGSEFDVSSDGDAGRVIIWSDGQTHFAGSVNARGGDFGGDGGFVEVSGSELNFAGFADRRAPRGKAGTLLLDPIDITIVAGMTDTNVTFSSNTYTGTGSASTGSIGVVNLVTNLEAGNVTVNAASGSGTGSGSITVNAAIAPMSGTGDLTFTATGPILISAPISILGDIAFTTTGTASGNYDGITISEDIETVESITLTGTAQGTGTRFGVFVDAGVSTAGGMGGITITGTSSATAGTNSAGVFVSDASGSIVDTGAGNVIITGSIPSGTASPSTGVLILSAGSTSGNFTITGTNGSSGADAVGAYIASSFGGAGSVTLMNCTGGSGSGGDGVVISELSLSSSGAVVGSGIVGGSGTGSCGIRMVATTGISGAGAITLGATTNGTGTGSHGIFLSGSSIAGSGVILLDATCGGIGVTSSSGIHITGGSITGGNNNITIIGRVSSSSGSNCNGTTMSTVNGITGSSGVDVRGFNSSSSSNCHGVVTTAAWDPGGLSTLTLIGTSSSSSYPIAIGANISNTNSITFFSDVWVTANSIVSTINTVGSGDMTFSALIDGATAGGQNLTLSPAGEVSFTGGIGTDVRLGTFSITSGTIANFPVQVNANSVLITPPLTLVQGLGVNNGGGAGAITFSDTIDGAEAVIITGGTGTTTFGGVLGGTTALTSLTVSAGTVVSESITTAGGEISITGALSVSATPTFDTTNGGASPSGANITFSSTVDGATAITLEAGTGGIISLGGAVGGTSPPTSLTLNTLNPMFIGGNITTSNSLSFPVAITLTGSSTITSNLGNVSFTSAVNGTTAGVQGLAVSANGTVTLPGTIGTTTRLSSFSVTSGTIIAHPSAITANSVSITPNLALTGPLTINNGSTSGAVSFGGTITNSSAQVLTITAGTGPITFGMNVGTSMNPLSSVIINSSGGVTAASIFANTINQTAVATGSSSYGALSAAAGGITLQGTTFSFSGAIEASGGGSFSLVNSGSATFSLSSSVTLGGTFSQSGGGSVEFGGGQIETTGSILFTNPVELTASLVADSNGGEITFQSAVTVGAGGVGLELTSDAAAIQFMGAIGTISDRINALTINACGGFRADDVFTGSINQTVAATGSSVFTGVINSTGSITLTGTSFSFNGGISATTFDLTHSANASFNDGCSLSSTFTETATGMGERFVSLGGTFEASSFTFNGPVFLGDEAIVTAPGGTVDFVNTVDGGGSLIAAASGGTVYYREAVGAISPVGALQTFGEAHLFANMTGSAGITFLNDIVLEANITITDTGSGITVNGAVNNPARDLILVGDVDIGGIVTLNSLDVTGNDFVRFSDVLTVTEDVSMTTTDETTAGYIFVSEINAGTGITLSPTNATTAGPSGSLNPVSIIYLNGDLDTTSGTIFLGASSPREAIVNRATIVYTLDSTITITAPTWTVGPNEMFTIFGSLNAMIGGTASFGEIVATDSITITSTSSVIDLHPVGLIYDSSQRIYFDTVTNILATAGEPSITGTISFTGTGGPANISQVDFTPAEFLSLLYFPSGSDAVFLTYDPTQIFPPPPSTTFSGIYSIYNMQIAVSELNTYLLPVWSDYRDVLPNEHFLLFQLRSKVEN